MKRRSTITKLIVAATFAIAAFIAIAAFSVFHSDTPKTPVEVQLSRPPFLSAALASAGDEKLDIGAKLDAEAGISAYFYSPGPINLTMVKNALLTVELDTPTYVIGSVDVPDYPEVFDTHVYVHVDGWFLAYYLRADPPSKALDTRAKSINSTVLEKALAVVAGAAGAPFSSATLYDFRYPNATHILLVSENYSDGTCFYITTPASYGYYDRGWAAYDANGNGTFTLNDVQATTVYSDGNYDIHYGTITATQLLPDVRHKICVDIYGSSYGILMIFYRIP